MTSRKRKKRRLAQRPPVEDAAPAAVVEPFHSPFRDLARAMRSRPAAPSSKPAAIRRRGPASSPPKTPAATDPSRQDAAPGGGRSDADVFSSSVEGAEPLPPSPPRVQRRRRVDLSKVGNVRREDVDSMARADGFDVSFDDLYVRGRAAGVSLETLARLERGEFAVSAHLDLHGLLLEDARREVDSFLAEQHRRGRRCVLLVTGKGRNSPGGTGILREQVPQWLARGPSARRVLAFASARPCDGGVGALVVLMRGGSSSKTRIDVEHGGVGRLPR